MGWLSISLETYVVDLVQIVGLQNPGADDTSTVGGTHLDIDVTEEDVPFTGNSGGLSLLGDLELGTKRSLRHGLGGDVPVVKGTFLGEVAGE